MKGSVKAPTDFQSHARGRHISLAQQFPAGRPVTPEQTQRYQLGSWAWMAVPLLADGSLFDEGATQAASCASTGSRSAWLHCSLSLPQVPELGNSTSQRAAINLCKETGRRQKTGWGRQRADAPCLLPPRSARPSDRQSARLRCTDRPQPHGEDTSGILARALRRVRRCRLESHLCH